MKNLIFAFLLVAICAPAYSSDRNLEKYITDFDYAARKEMKIDSKGLIKLLKEGKFSTTGILFDVGSDNIKPESFGTLKKIAEALQQEAGMNIKIVGHTDADGSDGSNLELSKNRATSVMNALTNEFGISESRLQTDGKGEADPVGDNATTAGKAQNRRVEFIKI